MTEETEMQLLRERLELAWERLREIPGELAVNEPYQDYFQRTAQFVLKMLTLGSQLGTLPAQDQAEKKQRQQAWMSRSIEELQEENKEWYAELLEPAYETSYANPAYACRRLGMEYGQLLSMLYAELRQLLYYVFEGRKEELVACTELFVQVYAAFTNEAPAPRELQDILYWFFSDYSDVFLQWRIGEQVDVSYDFAAQIIQEADVKDLRYLYRFGEYITDNELQTAAFLNTLPQEEIDRMAHVMVEGYRLGFVHAGIDLSKKKTVDLQWHLGFERVVQAAVREFAQLGLSATMYRKGAGWIRIRNGYAGATPNPQFVYDHRTDDALYLDKRYVERYLGAVKAAYGVCMEEARLHAGPAVMEVFGEKAFVPENKPESLQYTEKQQKLRVEKQHGVSRLVNTYIPGDERSFTVIAYPLPEIGERYPEIFREIIRINTLDAALYEQVQQRLIDALDTGTHVHIVGKGDNRTDLVVALQTLTDPEKETLFENCVADVNIPVGEVFTSPKLAGTNGVLHVSQVYLDEMLYQQLTITFTDGMVSEYSCDNFPEAAQGKAYIKERLLNFHDSVPLGEFAIGTNTTAYRMAQEYQIADKLPILIAEKMGPHFALGDTCYKDMEEIAVYNPNHKEIIARDNACSLLRKEDTGKAYFNTHVDITIPYDELGLIEVCCNDGRKIPLIKDGRFVLPGTEILNEPL